MHCDDCKNMHCSYFYLKKKWPIKSYYWLLSYFQSVISRQGIIRFGLQKYIYIYALTIRIITIAWSINMDCQIDIRLNPTERCKNVSSKNYVTKLRIRFTAYIFSCTERRSKMHNIEFMVVNHFLSDCCDNERTLILFSVRNLKPAIY